MKLFPPQPNHAPSLPTRHCIPPASAHCTFNALPVCQSRIIFRLDRSAHSETIGESGTTTRARPARGRAHLCLRAARRQCAHIYSLPGLVGPAHSPLYRIFAWLHVADAQTRVSAAAGRSRSAGQLSMIDAPEMRRETPSSRSLTPRFWCARQRPKRYDALCCNACIGGNAL